MDEFYRTGQWHGLTLYLCNYCAFDALDEGKMVEHYNTMHASQPRDILPGVLVADKSGHDVTQEFQVLEEKDDKTSTHGADCVGDQDKRVQRRRRRSNDDGGGRSK